VSSPTGTILAEGEPAAGAVVLLLLPRAPWVLAAAETAPDGSFALEPGEPAPGDASVLVTIRGPVVATAGYRPVAEAAGEWALDGPLHRLTLTVAGEAPEGALAFADPFELASVPPAAARLLRMRSPTVMDAHFVTAPLVDGTLELRVAPGLWVVGAGIAAPDGPLTSGPPPTGIGTIHAVSDGRELTGSPHAGYDVRVDGDTNVKLELGDSGEF
jgi:hypothetical protein